MVELRYDLNKVLYASLDKVSLNKVLYVSFPKEKSHPGPQLL